MLTTTAHYAYDTDTANTRVAEHEYALDLSDRWHTPAGIANGGYLLASTLRALHRDMAQPDLLVASAHYLRPGTAGPARVRTEAIRAGRRTATGQASLFRDEREILRVLATFTDLSTAAGPTSITGRAPDLPAPEECTDPLAAGLELPPIARRVQTRMPKVPGFLRGEPGGTSANEFWLRFADGRDADPIALAMLVDSTLPAVFDLGTVPASATVELTVHIRNRPAPGWLACRVATRYLIDGYHEEDFEIWDSTGTLVAQSRQLSLIP
ncbi:thioesterase family protein [Nocardia arthritidis]|uniref:Thioesterase family protein n=1 Tax=Nocardia arthritidis TaxID=228602 RepID=A0A6G9YH83_9NOCA|nr:thioesterase family protein [Nocardia arthritidis]QIS12323.1 thioesterase family protein [Nocardia arthritidis]